VSETAKPRILSSQSRPVIERAPPDIEHIKPHEWLSSEMRASYAERLDGKGAFDLYISKTAVEKMLNHTKRFGRLRKEAMGFMLGDICEHEGRRFVMVRDIVTGALLSSADRVRFDNESYYELFSELDSSGFDYVIVGWYHSHPGYGCFMSSVDLNTQVTSFHESFHSAIVVDPITKEIAAFKLKGRRCPQIDFAVYWHELETPYGAPKIKKVRVVKKKS